ncbi:putative acetyltransferase [Pullulanibacillus pueri]|uniref:N-acetyltransferase domain-containing protein n=1 Tax=Pullulanibacillus pueri TaxID=1437324 RepID=A0A8J2ZTY8_9BACL|nr:GNAT family N-acetyltransferase [Pullulanibacillus pueri]MBM7681112.1 putative acetyltransferase [Pullulanibacillus pueri]GGH77093.1 hypothetical protein GCM10007096_08480 [Pullulanibacillus pueri]
MLNTIEIVPIPYKDKEVLRQLLEFYLYDFSECEGFDLYPHGRYEYKYLDHYWTEPSRQPFFILADHLYAGFILLREEEDGTQTIAEFFIMRKYRRQGIGKYAAECIFDLFPGKWRVSEMATNIKAQYFWRHVIGDYTGGKYEEKISDNDDWKGPIQTFTNFRGEEGKC